MRARILALGLVAVVMGGCYKVTVVTGAPSSPNQIDKEWQMSFVAGLVPPPEIDTQSECPGGVAEVRTERSFLNSLVAALSNNLVTPIHTTVVCASGPVAR